MASRKRPADQEEGSDPIRMQRVRPSRSQGDEKNAAKGPDVSSALDAFRVDIKVQSKTKAEQNDPKPKGYWKEKLAQDVRERLDLAQQQEAVEGAMETDFEPSTAGIPEASHLQYAMPKSQLGEQNNEIYGIRSQTIAAKDAANDGDELGEVDSYLDEEEELSSDQDEPDEDDTFDNEFCPESEDGERSEYGENFEFKWLEELDGYVLRKDPGPAIDTSSSTIQTSEERIGSCKAKLIRREQVCATFYDEVEEPSRDTSELAFDLFDRYGRLRPELKEHPVRKGSGVWNKEFDSGDLLLIELLQIDASYRRLGLARRLLAALLEKAGQKTQKFFAIAWPTFLNTRDRHDEVDSMSKADFQLLHEHEQSISIKFFRSIGFRRVGSSQYFAWAGDLNHPSHLLAAQDDYNPPAPRLQVPDLTFQSLKEILVQLEDALCVERLDEHIQKVAAEHPCWLSADESGNTILHIAALYAKPKSVDWIMNKPVVRGMQDMRNNNGDTPLEAVLLRLEEIRTHLHYGAKTIHRSDKFQGHPDSLVLCIARLSGLHKLSSLDFARLKYGCTCGKCISGFLSPRMSLALLCQAECNHDLISGEFSAYSGPDWVEFNEHNLEYVPQPVRDNMKTNKSMRQGFANLYQYFAASLAAQLLPIQDNILSELQKIGEWPPVTKSFLQRGGTVYSVGSMIFKGAMEQDELSGDGQHQEIFSDDIEKLPECRNDREFGFVSKMCGYRRVSVIQYVSVRTGEPIEDD